MNLSLVVTRTPYLSDVSDYIVWAYVLPENLIRVRFGPICSLYHAGMWQARVQDALIGRGLIR